MTLSFNEFHLFSPTKFALLAKVYAVLAKRYWRSSATVSDSCWFFPFSIEFSVRPFRIFVFEICLITLKQLTDLIQIFWRIFSRFSLISVQSIGCLAFIKCGQFSNKWINPQTHCLSACLFWLNFDLPLPFSIVFWFCYWPWRIALTMSILRNDESLILLRCFSTAMRYCLMIS